MAFAFENEPDHDPFIDSLLDFQLRTKLSTERNQAVIEHRRQIEFILSENKNAANLASDRKVSPSSFTARRDQDTDKDLDVRSGSTSPPTSASPGVDFPNHRQKSIDIVRQYMARNELDPAIEILHYTLPNDATSRNLLSTIFFTKDATTIPRNRKNICYHAIKKHLAREDPSSRSSLGFIVENYVRLTTDKSMIQRPVSYPPARCRPNARQYPPATQSRPNNGLPVRQGPPATQSRPDNGWPARQCPPATQSYPNNGLPVRQCPPATQSRPDNGWPARQCPPATQNHPSNRLPVRQCPPATQSRPDNGLPVRQCPPATQSRPDNGLPVQQCPPATQSRPDNGLPVQQCPPATQSRPNNGLPVHQWNGTASSSGKVLNNFNTSLSDSGIPQQRHQPPVSRPPPSTVRIGNPETKSQENASVPLAAPTYIGPSTASRRVLQPNVDHHSAARASFRTAELDWSSSFWSPATVHAKSVPVASATKPLSATHTATQSAASKSVPVAAATRPLSTTHSASQSAASKSAPEAAATRPLSTTHSASQSGSPKNVPVAAATRPPSATHSASQPAASKSVPVAAATRPPSATHSASQPAASKSAPVASATKPLPATHSASQSAASKSVPVAAATKPQSATDVPHSATQSGSPKNVPVAAATRPLSTTHSASQSGSPKNVPVAAATRPSSATDVPHSATQSSASQSAPVAAATKPAISTEALKREAPNAATAAASKSAPVAATAKPAISTEALKREAPNAATAAASKSAPVAATAKPAIPKEELKREGPNAATAAAAGAVVPKPAVYSEPAPKTELLYFDDLVQSGLLNRLDIRDVDNEPEPDIDVCSINTIDEIDGLVIKIEPPDDNDSTTQPLDDAFDTPEGALKSVSTELEVDDGIFSLSCLNSQLVVAPEIAVFTVDGETSWLVCKGQGCSFTTTSAVAMETHVIVAHGMVDTRDCKITVPKLTVRVTRIDDSNLRRISASGGGYDCADGDVTDVRSSTNDDITGVRMRDSANDDMTDVRVRGATDDDTTDVTDVTDTDLRPGDDDEGHLPASRKRKRSTDDEEEEEKDEPRRRRKKLNLRFRLDLNEEFIINRQSEDDYEDDESCGNCGKQFDVMDIAIDPWIQCDLCDVWFHGSCQRLSADAVRLLGRTSIQFKCSRCTRLARKYQRKRYRQFVK